MAQLAISGVTIGLLVNEGLHGEIFLTLTKNATLQKNLGY